MAHLAWQPLSEHQGNTKETPRKHHGSNFRGVPSCSKENVLGKDHLLQRNQYKIFCRQQDEINAYRGTSTKIVTLDVILDDESLMFTES